MARKYTKSSGRFERISAQKSYEMFKDMTLDEAASVTVGFGAHNGKNILSVPVHYMAWARENIIGTSLPVKVAQFMYAVDLLYKHCEEVDGYLSIIKTPI